MAIFNLSNTTPVTAGLTGENFFFGAFTQGDATPFVATLEALAAFIDSANLFVRTTGISIGNDAANLFANSITLQIANSIASANLSAKDLKIGTSTVNTTVLSAGSNVTLNVTGYLTGNSTVNLIANSTLISITNPSSTINIQSTGIVTGTASINSATISAPKFSTTGPISANGGIGTAGQVLTSDGFISYWDIPPVGNPVGANTDIQFNVSGVFGGNDSFTFNSDTLTLGIGANVAINTVFISVGNATANLKANSILVKIANSTSTANLQPTQLTIGTSVVNVTTVSAAQIVGTANVVVGANVYLDVTHYSAGNTTANLTANSILLSVANASTSANLSPKDLIIGTTIVNAAAVTTTKVTITGPLSANGGLGSPGQVLTTNGAGAYWTAAPAGNPAGANTDIQLNISGSFQGSDSLQFNTDSNTLSVGANVTINTNTLFIGNTIASMFANSITIHVANGTGTAAITPTAITVGSVTMNATVVSTAGLAATANVTVGSNVLVDTTHLLIGNTTANLNANSILLKVANSTATANLSPASLTVGPTVINAAAVTTPKITITGALSANGGVGLPGQSLVSDGTIAYWANGSIVGGSNTAIQFNASGSLGGNDVFQFDYAALKLFVGANLTINTSVIVIGNSIVNSVANSTVLKLANSTVNTALTLPTTTQYSGSFFLHANGTWATPTVSTSASAPSSPADGTLWWDRNLGKLLIYYDDGVSAQWVQTSI